MLKKGHAFNPENRRLGLLIVLVIEKVNMCAFCVNQTDRILIFFGCCNAQNRKDSKETHTRKHAQPGVINVSG